MIEEYRFFCKDYASERNESLLTNCPVQLFFCKDTLFFRKKQGIIGKCLRVRKIKRIRCILACPMYEARRIHLIIYMRDICPIAYFTIFMVLFPHFRINKPLPGILFFWNSEVFILHTSWPSALYT